MFKKTGFGFCIPSCNLKQIGHSKGTISEVKKLDEQKFIKWRQNGKL